MSASHDLSNFVWSIADLLRGPYRPPQYERVMLPLVVPRRFDCVLKPTKQAVLEKFAKLGGKLNGEARDKTNAGYEINFNRHFYSFKPPRPQAEIDADLKMAEAEIIRLLTEMTAQAARP